MSASIPAPPVWEAVIIPHRSLGPHGLRWVLGFLCTASAVISAGLWWAGAWPVICFNAVEIGLAIWLLRRNARRAGTTEVLVLAQDGLRIVRTDPAGRSTERVLQPGWLRCTIEERAGSDRAGTPALWLTDRGFRMEVGVELAEREKRDLAVALDRALDRLQRPRFNNPQLR